MFGKIDDILLKYGVEVLLSTIGALVAFLWAHIKDYDGLPYILLLTYLGLYILMRFYFSRSINLDKIKSCSDDLARYNIVIIDDDSQCRTRSRGILSNYRVSAVEKIDSTRYLYGFDVIIFDVVNTVSFDETSLGLMKELKEAKPNKYIIAISAQPSMMEECNAWADAIIIKDNQFDKKLKLEVNTAFAKLDNPAEYWKTISNKSYFNKSRAEAYKSDYVNTLIHSPHFSS